MIEILKVIGACLLGFVAFIALNLLGYWQATKDMTVDEKKKFDDYIKENGIFNDPDDFM